MKTILRVACWIFAILFTLSFFTLAITGISIFQHKVTYFCWCYLSFIPTVAMWLFILFTEAHYFWY